MLGEFFNGLFSFFSEVLTIDFGLGIDLGSVIIMFFTLLAFIRFFIRPIVGGALTSSSSRSSKGKGNKP